GARRLLSMYAVAPGTRIVVVTASDRGIRAVLALRDAGIEVVAVADLRPAPSRTAARLERLGIDMLYGWTAAAAIGKQAVTGVVLEALSPNRPGTPARRQLDCDLIVVAGGDAPAAPLP